MNNKVNCQKNKKNNAHIVKYNNELDNIVFLHLLSSKEIDIFNAICINVRDTGTSTVHISFEELKELADYKNKNSDRFFEDIKNSCQKISVTQLVVESENRIRNINLFSFYDLNEKEKKLSIKMNEDFIYFFNNLKENITTVFDIKTSNKMRSKYAKMQYRIIIKYAKEGYYEETLLDFKKRMGIMSMETRDICKGIINPIEKIFLSIFDNFQVIKEKKGREINKLIWTWKEKDNNPYKFFDNIFSSIEVNFTNKIQTKIIALQKEKNNEEIESLIHEAWEIIKKNPKVKNPPALLSKAITDIGLEEFINNSKEMEHKIKCNKESIQREKKWEKEKEEYNNQDRKESLLFSEFQELPQEKREEIYSNAQKMFKEKTGNLVPGTIDNIITITCLMPYIKSIMKEKESESA